MKQFTHFFKGFVEGLKGFGLTINTLISALLLLIVYLIGIGITSIIAKISGKHFLDIQSAPQHETYWTELALEKKPIDNYYKQF